MIPDLVQPHLDELRHLCARFGVSRLELFGSATTRDFDPSKSDLDFLVEFEARDGGHFDAYFGLLEALEGLFERPIDLVMIRAVSNPYFFEGIEDSRTLLYAA